MDNMEELNLEQIEEVTGGKNEGGYVKKPAAKRGCKIYRIVHGDTLTKIANGDGTTVTKLMAINPELQNKSFIVSGCYIYIPS